MAECRKMCLNINIRQIILTDCVKQKNWVAFSLLNHLNANWNALLDEKERPLNRSHTRYKFGCNLEALYGVWQIFVRVDPTPFTVKGQWAERMDRRHACAMKRLHLSGLNTRNLYSGTSFQASLFWNVLYRGMGWPLWGSNKILQMMWTHQFLHF